MDRQNFAIGCLSLSALMLLVGIVVVTALQTSSAQASGMITSAGRYTMLTGRLDNATELVYVIDTQANKMLAYRLNPSSRQIELTQPPLNLDEGGAPQQGRQNMRP